MPPPAKRRRINNSKIEEITFDPDARREYLTGFHKRKQQRIENAREAAVKREKEERVRDRRQLREQRKEDLENHVAQVNAELRKLNPDLTSEAESEDDGNNADEWNGVDDGALEAPQDEEEEFVDEDKYTTVTVEPMADPGAELDDEDQAKAILAKRQAEEVSKPKKRPRGKDGKPAKKKQKFRYESKAERSATRQKQKSKNHAAKVRRTGK